MDSLEEAVAPVVEVQVVAGNSKTSPIVEAIAEAESGTSGEIRVHLTKRWFERDPYARAQALFKSLGMTETRLRNGVLLYANLRKRRFAVVGDEGIHQAVGQEFWEGLAKRLSERLLSTHPERAIAAAVQEIGIELKRHFPSHASPDGNPNELSNEITED